VWQRLHIVKERPAPTLGNVLAILDGDPRWSSRFAYDTFALDVCVDRAALPPELGTALTAKLAYDYALDTKTDLLLECMLVAAKRRPFHPVREWLDSLVWDGTPRMNDLMHLGFGASPTADDEIIRLVGERFLLSMVARIYKPGAKVDTVLVLVGKQGAKKSTALATLAGEDWFGSTDLDLANKDSYMQLRGKWLYELAEFHSVKKAEASKAKSWLSNSKDTYRAPYMRRSEDIKRQTVMAASTNDEDEFLMDHTGWRRYWPVKVGFQDLKWIEANRGQLFAEAVVRYRAGEAWWFDEGTPEAARLQAVTSSFQAVHPWAEVVHAFVLNRKTDDAFSAVDVMRLALGRQTGDLTHGEKTLVGQILRHQVRCPAEKGPAGTLYRRPSYMPAVTGVRNVLAIPAK
jgi:putative DNA primase/helicase